MLRNLILILKLRRIEFLNEVLSLNAQESHALISLCTLIVSSMKS